MYPNIDFKVCFGQNMKLNDFFPNVKNIQQKFFLATQQKRKI